jgi:hypothetical protein
MSVTVESTIDLLRTETLADPNHHLKPGGVDEVRAELERLRSLGLLGHVLVVDRGDPIEQLISAWDTLDYDAERDLLLVYDTHDWVARGWGLDRERITRELEAAQPHRRTTYARALVGALGRLADARFTRNATSEGDGRSLGWPIAGGIGVASVGAVIALAIRRRNRLAKEGLANLNEARASAERAYADLILACEDLPGAKEAAELQLRATELKKRMDGVIGRIEASPVRGTDPVEIGRIRQLENELAALRSTALQKENS